MRYLVTFALGFGAACGCAAYGVAGEFWYLGALLLFIICLAVPSFRRISLLFLGCCVGLLWYDFFSWKFLDDAVALDGVTMDVSVRAADYSYETGYAMAVDGYLSLAGKNYQVRTYLDAGEEIHPGEVLTGLFRFRVTVSGGKEEATHHPGKGIFLLAYQEGDLVRRQGEPSWRDYPAILRREIRSILNSCFPADAAPFARALLMGDTTDLGYEADTNLKISGIRHVAAVSGLHVSILFSLISMMTFRKRYLMALLGAPLLLLFAAVSGFTPSVCRASIMSGLMLAGLLLDREYDGPTALAFASVAMLLINPLLITNTGFQLSVASVAGIYLFCSKIQGWLLSLCPQTGKVPKFLSWAAASVATTLSALVFTTPLCAVYFGAVSLVSVFTNLLTLWLITLVFYGIMGVCVIYLLSASAAAVLAGFLAFPIRFILGTAEFLAHLPMAAVYTRSVYICVWLVLLYLLLGTFLLGKGRKPKLFVCCAVLSLCLAVLAGWLEPMRDSVRFTVLDVGQGQCLLFQSDGRTVLVDCGGERSPEAADAAAETLLSQGISRLDGIILTHLDEDHAGGVPNLLSRIETQLLILPPVPADLGSTASAQVIYAAEDLELNFGGTSIRIFAPKFRGNSNENSLCILFDTEKCDILVTGDRSGFGERSLLRQTELPVVDVLVAGHHGSKNATSLELLQAVRPEIVCISAGRDNAFGHPAPQTLKRLKDFGCAVYRTDIHGSIVIRR